MARTSITKARKTRPDERPTGPRHLRLVDGHEPKVGAAAPSAGRSTARSDRTPSWTLFHEDCVRAMQRMPAASIDSVVCDPPYALSFMGAEWDSYSAHEFQRFCERWGAEALRVLKPGGYLLAFSSARTYHRLTCGLEDAGFAIVDQLQWLTAQGMPKARSIGRELGHASKTALPTALKPAHEPIVVAQKPREGSYVANVRVHAVGAMHIDACRTGTVSTGAATDGRWPANVLLGHSSACRQLPDVEVRCRTHWSKGRVSGYGARIGTGAATYEGVGHRPSRESVERWACERGCPVAALDQQSTSGPSRFFLTVPADEKTNPTDGTTVEEGSTVAERGSITMGRLPIAEVLDGREPGFLFCPKVKGGGERDAGLGDRPAQPCVPFRSGTEVGGKPSSLPAGPPTAPRNTHATVKPIALMRWLLRLVTPPGGRTLDPFCGSGSTGCAVMAENADRGRAPGWSFVGIEREAEYVAIARRRIAHWEETAASGSATGTVSEAA